MKKILFQGCGTAIATPFTKDGVNLIAFKKLIMFQLQNQADALIVCGTTGEATTMSQEEKRAVVTCAIETVCHKIPIIVGCGSNNTKQAIENAKEMESLGADGLLVVTPYYNKCTQEGLIRHFTAIANAVSIPIVLYNVPSRTGMNIEPSTCFALSQIENIVAIKEASGNLSQVAEIAHLCGDSLAIYSGNDDLIVPILSLGGLGVISVVSNIKPQLIHTLVTNFLAGDSNKAKEIQLSLLPLIHCLFSEVNPIPIKEALNLCGFDFGLPRLPLTPMSKENQTVLQEVLKDFS